MFKLIIYRLVLTVCITIPVSIFTLEDPEVARLQALLDSETLDSNPIERFPASSSLLKYKITETAEPNSSQTKKKAKNEGVVVGYVDDNCSNSVGWIFDDFAALKAFDGTEIMIFRMRFKIFFGSYHTFDQPEYCYTLTSDEEMEEIVVIGRRLTPLEEPEADEWDFEDQSRRIWAQPPEYGTWQSALDGFNACWQNKAEQLGLKDFRKNTGYKYIFWGHLNALGATYHPPFRKEIVLGRTDIQNHAKDFGYNFWHLTMQTAIHEWVHAEVGVGPWGGRPPWRRVTLEWDAQRTAYDRYKAIYDQEPPQSYNTLKTFEMTESDWDDLVSNYNELQAKIDSGETLDDADQLKYEQIQDQFTRMEKRPAKHNPLYSYNHFNLCE